jgi:uncharacterized membrane protein
MSEESSFRRIRPRIENLSDLVFGLALSIGSLTLIANIPRNAPSLGNDIIYFGFSFLIVIMTWSGYTRTIAYLPIETEGIFFLNVVLLFVVALEPFLFYVLISQTGSSVATLAFLDSASVAYALDVGIMYLMLAGFNYMVTVEEKRKTNPSEILIKRFRRLTYLLLFGAGLFLISALPYFWVSAAVGVYLRFDFWYASIAMFVGTRFASRGSKVNTTNRAKQ